jgi:pimeloyl-ACP methyl ester carboxylesterase
MAEIRVPTLVLHGTDDPFFPLAHGRALAAEIAGAKLLPLAGMGHEVPPRALWDVVVPAVVEHSSG